MLAPTTTALPAVAMDGTLWIVGAWRLSHRAEWAPPTATGKVTAGSAVADPGLVFPDHREET